MGSASRGGPSLTLLAVAIAYSQEREGVLYEAGFARADGERDQYHRYPLSEVLAVPRPPARPLVVGVAFPMTVLPPRSR